MKWEESSWKTAMLIEGAHRVRKSYFVKDLAKKVTNHIIS